MKWCRFKFQEEVSFGVVDGDAVTRVCGSPFHEFNVTETRYNLCDVKLLVPIVPPTFYAAGFNYPDHIIAIANSRGETPKTPARPDVGYRSNSALIAHEENIVKPADASDLFQYEAELVAVIGKKGRHVAKEDALSHLFGWTIGNDVSERTWQRADRTLWRGKNSDTFKPMGPWIVTDLDLENAQVTVRINGEVRETFAARNMIFDVTDFICEITKYITLHPGDVIWMGTDKAPKNMVPGDVVEIEISGIGILRNYVVQE
jgi:2-keto-4-pentenoate hydratase/2-oxohepta-3-ene-1,7-dioic acid hydratase in catechol pathway